MSNGDKSPKGLGGWLIIPAILLFLTSVKISFILIFNTLPVFIDGYWPVLTSPGSEAYNVFWAPLLLFTATGNLFFLVSCFILLILFFIKHYRFPSLYIGFLLLNLVFLISAHLFGKLIPEIANDPDSNSFGEIILSFFESLIWISYFLNSKRVENTFIKPGFENTDNSVEISGQEEAIE